MHRYTESRKEATSEQAAGWNGKSADPNLLDVTEVAAVLQCSTRSVWRFCDAGTAPPPLRIGNLRRWRREEILAWIEAGCPAVRTEER